MRGEGEEEGVGEEEEEEERVVAEVGVLVVVVVVVVEEGGPVGRAPGAFVRTWRKVRLNRRPRMRSVRGTVGRQCW